MSDKPNNQAKSSDKIENKANEKQALNPAIAKLSQTGASGKAAMEATRTNKHSGSAGGDSTFDSITIEAIDDGGNKRKISRRDGGSERDLDKISTDVNNSLPNKQPSGGYEKIHNTEGGILLKGVIPGTDAELENLTTDTMEALAPENRLIRDALEIRKNLDKHMEPGPERENLINQLKSDVTASLFAVGWKSHYLARSDSNDDETHQAINTDNIETASKKSAALPLDKHIDEIEKFLLNYFEMHLVEQKQRSIGAVIGTIESIGEFTVDLANVAEFVGDVIIGNKKGAEEKGAKFGESIGRTIVGGIHVFSSAHRYLYDIGYEGDYYKPARDLYILGKSMDQEWKNLSPLEQERLKYKLATDVVGGAIPIGSALKITKAQKLTTALEEAALLGNEINHGEKAAKAINTIFEDFLGPKRTKESIKNAYKGESVETGLNSVIDRVQRRLAGAGGAWDTINELEADDVVKQFHRRSCVSAIGEMLTNGQVKQKTLIKELIKYWPEEMREKEMEAAFEWLGRELRELHDSRWRSEAVSEESLWTLLKKGPFGAELHEPGAPLSHAVVIDGIDDSGYLKVMDPWGKGTRYGMTIEEFNEYWTLHVCYME